MGTRWGLYQHPIKSKAVGNKRYSIHSPRNCSPQNGLPNDNPDKQFQDETVPMMTVPGLGSYQNSQTLSTHLFNPKNIQTTKTQNPAGSLCVIELRVLGRNRCFKILFRSYQLYQNSFESFRICPNLVSNRYQVIYGTAMAVAVVGDLPQPPEAKYSQSSPAMYSGL